jgi:hypothetical protein
LLKTYDLLACTGAAPLALHARPLFRYACDECKMLVFGHVLRPCDGCFRPREGFQLFVLEVSVCGVCEDGASTPEAAAQYSMSESCAFKHISLEWIPALLEDVVLVALWLICA